MQNDVKQLQRVVIKEEFYILTGNHYEAALLNNFVFWNGIIEKQDKTLLSRIRQLQVKNAPSENIERLKNKLRNGWFFKTGEELTQELMGWGSNSKVTRATDNFVNNGWIEKGNNPDQKMKWDRSKWYRVNIQKIASDLYELGYHLEGYTLYQPNIDKSEEENNKTDRKIDKRNDSEIDKKDGKTAPSSIFQNEKSTLQNEKSTLQNEKSTLQNERTIPESNQQKVTTESNNINVCKEDAPKELTDLINSREDLQTHTHKIFNLFNTFSKQKTFKLDVFMKTLEIINVDVKGIGYLENALTNNLKKGFVKTFDNKQQENKKSDKLPKMFESQQQVQSEELPEERVAYLESLLNF